MRKVAFLGDPWSGTVKRAKAFASQNLDIKFTFVNMPVWINDHYEYYQIDSDFPDNIREIRFDVFSHNEYDLVLNLNDKHFDKILSVYAPELKNLFNKSELNSVLKNNNFEYLKSDNFELEDTVFVKPIFGSGQYCPPHDRFSYRVHQYKSVKHVNGNFFTIQEYINNPSIISVLFVSNGKSVEFLDITDAIYLFDAQGKSLNTGVESKHHIKDRYEIYISESRRLIDVAGYNKIKGVFMIQFLTDHKSGRKIICDFNMRTGPAADEVTINNVAKLQVHNSIKFMLGEIDFADIDIKPARYRCYLEIDGKVLANFDNIKYNSRILVDGEKGSGLIRSEYKTYIEKL